MDEQAIENEWRMLVSERVLLGQRLDKVSSYLNSKLQIEDVFQKTGEQLLSIKPIYAEIRTTSCLRWMD